MNRATTCQTSESDSRGTRCSRPAATAAGFSLRNIARGTHHGIRAVHQTEIGASQLDEQQWNLLQLIRLSLAVGQLKAKYRGDRLNATESRHLTAGYGAGRSLRRCCHVDVC